MDIKLDFVPPSLINFVARQLIGNGHKLYQKAVGSVATSDEDYQKALQGSLYARIRKGLNSGKKIEITLAGSDEEKCKALPSEEHNDKNALHEEIRPVTEIVEEKSDEHLVDASSDQLTAIQEHFSKKSSLGSPEPNTSRYPANIILQTDEYASKETIFVSPEVAHALKTLDQAIAVIRGQGFSDCNQSDCSINEGVQTSEADPVPLPTNSTVTAPNNSNKETLLSNGEQVSPDVVGFRSNEMNSGPREGDADDKPELSFSDNMIPSYARLAAEGVTTMTQPPVSESMRKVCDEESLRMNGFNGTSSPHVGDPKSKSKQANKKKLGLCGLILRCF